MCNHMTTPDSMSIFEDSCHHDQEIADREAEIEETKWCKDCECDTLGEPKHRYHNTVPMYICSCGDEFFDYDTAFNCCAKESIQR